MGGLQWGTGVLRGRLSLGHRGSQGEAFSGPQGFPVRKLAVGHKENPASLCIYVSVAGDLEQTYFVFPMPWPLNWENVDIVSYTCKH